MTKPRILAILMVTVFLGCKEIQPHSERPLKQRNSEPTISAPEKGKRDSLRMSPAKRELRKKEGEHRKKGLDTLKPVTT